MGNERIDKIRAHMIAFNELMRDLERQGYRSGGWDEKTDKTAIVKPGEMPWESKIVGYIDRNLNIEWIE